ncbi:Dabb family protein [Ferruginibacter sp. SUN002]|uniref:Dabb family protein n=1 Tax=Ferruginibacter sp. SUN002 TaxID=2937789 RepID=UPI003D35D545
MLTHHVLFWLKPETTEQQKADFKKGLESLKGVETIQSIYVGTPVPEINRPVVDTTYTFSLVLVFNDIAGHDVYQTHPVHKAFLDNFRVFFEKVIIYDAA